MTIVVSLIGLGLLIFVHELGHFSTSLALRMRPRKFYIGFPPAILKRTRNGIEYGVGAIPLGGFVKIPGMHRPAPIDVDRPFVRAIEEVPALAAPVDAVRHALAVDDHDAARAALESLSSLIAAAQLSSRPHGLPSTGSPTSVTRSGPTPTGVRRPGSGCS
jgi:membrane-associated protease RseP (regulator of RpoE activity)